jgi:two-component system nitrate/nitrite response regulator NarL
MSTAHSGKAATESALKVPVVAPAGKPIHVLIADDSRMGCQLLKNELERSRHRFEVVACSVNRAEMIDALGKTTVEVALISENLQDGPYMGFEVMREIRFYHPSTDVIVLLKSSSRDLVIDAFRGGAKGVFCRAEPVESLCKCIHAVHGGQVWANSNELKFLLDALANASPLRVVNSQGLNLLAKREDEVASLVAEGLTNREIAQKLGLSEHTVSNYLFRIYNKLGISSRVELVLYVLKGRQQS